MHSVCHNEGGEGTGDLDENESQHEQMAGGREEGGEEAAERWEGGRLESYEGEGWDGGRLRGHKLCIITYIHIYIYI